MGLDTSGIRPKEGRLGYLSLIGKAAVPKTASRGFKAPSRFESGDIRYNVRLHEITCRRTLYINAEGNSAA